MKLAGLPTPKGKWSARLGQALVFLALTGQVATARASHPLATDDVGTVGGGGGELEVSGLVGGPVEGGGRLDLDLGMALHVGLFDAVDVGASLALHTSVGDGVASDLVASPLFDLKVRLLSPGEDGTPGFAVRLDYQPPTPIEGGLTGHDAGAVVVTTFEAGVVAIHVNLGATGRALASSEQSLTLLGASTGVVSVGGAVALAGEVVFEGTPGDGLVGVSGLAAVMWEAEPSRILSAGVGPSWSPDGGFGWVASVGITAGTQP